MRPDNVAGHREEPGPLTRCDGRIKRFGTKLRMPFHDLKFFVCQSTWLQEDTVGDTNFANIVQRAR